MSTEVPHCLPRQRERHFGNRVLWCFAERPRSVHAALSWSMERHPDRTAMIFGERSWSYAELGKEVARIAAGLDALEVRRGDRVGMLIANRPDFVTLFLALQRIGAVAVPMDVRLQGAEIAHALTLCGARLLCHDSDLEDRLGNVSGDVDRLALPKEDGLFSQFTAAQAPEAATPDEDDPALILFTSGTTGKPKGAVLTHLNIVHSTLHHCGNLGLTEADRSLVAVPLSHVTGVICGILAPFWTGGTLILMPRFKAREFLAAAGRWRMTYTIMVPAMYSLCLRDETFDTVDLSAWRLGHYGASPMPEDTLETLRRKLPQLVLVDGYGATETCSPALMTPVGKENGPQVAAAQPLPCVEIMIADPETGIEVPAGESGELWIRGPNVSPGYWGDTAATAAAFVGGFWRSGDVGRLDADGGVVIHDRLKDVINRGGYKIYSAEVEAVLERCPGVEAAAVIGVSDPVLGERVHAVVQAAGGVTDDVLSAFCADRLGDYKVPESWCIGVAELPRNSMGKIDKKALRADVAAGAGQKRIAR